MRESGRETQGYVLIIAAMLIWGSVGIFARFTGVPSTVIVFYRVITAFVLMGIIWIAQGLRGVEQLKVGWKIALGSGVALGLNWFFFFTAVAKTTVANAVLSYYTSPIIVTILSPLLLREKVERKTGYALLCGFLGILAMVVGPGVHLKQADLWGIGCGLLAAFFYALLTISGKLVHLSAQLLVLVQAGVSSLIFLPYALGQPLPHGRTLLLLLIIGAVHTALALTMYFTGVKWVKVQHVGILGYLDPLSAIIFAMLFLGEIPGWTSLLGGGLILLSSYLVLKNEQ